MKIQDLINPDVSELIDEINKIDNAIDYIFKRDRLIIKASYDNIVKIDKILLNVEDYCSISNIDFKTKDYKIIIYSYNY